MQLPRRGLPSQRYSPESDYGYDNDMVQNTRRPLAESTGNVQQHNLNALALCQQSNLSPPLHSIPTPPIVPTQAITSTYGTSFRNHRSFSRDVSIRESSMAHSRGGRNPIYSWKHFADYRAKVTQKESENEDPTWPLYLEDAFLDALLLIPQMGRKKFSSKGVLYGRNMLLTEYLWICHWILYPPQQGDVIPVGKSREKHPMYRTRKQISSHIQVLKGFFVTLPTFHFFFPRKADGKDEERRNIKEEDGEMESFKNNRVLIALAEGRLPDERPNYDYFARLLAADSEVFVRPKTCWIYVSSSDISLADDCKKAYASDGTCLEADAIGPDGTRLESKGDYPHLILNSNKETRKDLDRSRNDNDPPKYLLHEYTRSLTQKESTSMRDISSKWDRCFPDLRDKLTAALEDTHPSHERTSRCVVGPCDTIQFEVVLDLHATSQFPSGTHLEGAVELQIGRPELANHRWRSVTSIQKPSELEYGEAEESFWNCVTPCHLTGRQKDVIVVPFPATSWANTFIRLANYVSAERDRKDRRTGRGLKKEDGDDTSKPSGKNSTPADLLSQVAMYQEIWSAPQDGSKDPQWTRRSVILWTFAHVQSKTDEKGKVATVPPGTNWRFLTKVDPTSQFHQQRAYVSGSPQVSRDHIMSPNPSFAHHINAAMQENFTTSYDTPGMGLPSQQPHSSLANLNLLDGFSSGGLVTPPPTASLSSSGYTHSFDSTNIEATDSLHHHLSFLSDTSGTDGRSNMVGGDASDPFLSSLGVTVNSPFDDPDCDPNMQAWTSATSGGLQGLDPVSQWTTAYVDGQQGWGDASNADLNEAATQWNSASRDPTPWDGQDAAWGTTTSQSEHHDAWTTPTATSNAWLHSISASADSNSGPDAWLTAPSTSASSGSSLVSYLPQQTQQMANSPILGGGVYASPPRQLSLQSGFKRSRDIDDDGSSDGEGSLGGDYPVYNIRKLTHNSSSRVPNAIMMESENKVEDGLF